MLLLQALKKNLFPFFPIINPFPLQLYLLLVDVSVSPFLAPMAYFGIDKAIINLSVQPTVFNDHSSNSLKIKK